MRNLFVSLVLLVACGTKTNPDVCCTDAADCAAKGVPDGSMCSGGLVCRGNTCIAETCTTSDQCEPGAPFCGSSMLCTATCAMDSECPGFAGDASHVFCESGSCVACRDGKDCTADAPVCSSGACVGCALDSDCTSSLCGAGGVCVSAAAIVYLDPAGIDAGNCEQTSPCKTLTYGITKANANRTSIEMAQGQYVELVDLEASTTTAPKIEIHGNGSSLVPPYQTDITSFKISAGFTTFSISNMALLELVGFGVSASSPLDLRDVVMTSLDSNSVRASAGLTAHNVASSGGLDISGQFTADRVTVDGGNGVLLEPGAVVIATNLLVHHSRLLCMYINQGVTGTIAFSTVADCGGDANYQVDAVSCVNSSVAFQASIIWTAGTKSEITGCNLSKVIVGPVAITGISSADPKFVNEAGRDYHLQATSPALDLSETGPPSDLTGVSRPQGIRFDIGAFEYKP